MIPGRWGLTDAIVLRSPSLGAFRRTSPPDSARAGCGMAPRQLPPVLAGLAMPGKSSYPGIEGRFPAPPEGAGNLPVRSPCGPTGPSAARYWWLRVVSLG
jgi:hypothetical protein